MCLLRPTVGWVCRLKELRRIVSLAALMLVLNTSTTVDGFCRFSAGECHHSAAVALGGPEGPQDRRAHPGQLRRRQDGMGGQLVWPM